MENNSLFLGVVVILNAAVFVVFFLLLTGFFGFESANAAEMTVSHSAIESHIASPFLGHAPKN